jgi:hypothetical protein
MAVLPLTGRWNGDGDFLTGCRAIDVGILGMCSKTTPVIPDAFQKQY